MASFKQYFQPVFKTALENDLDTIVQIHLLAYSKKHFTSRLPARILKAYYRYFLERPAQTILLEGASVLGFAVCGCGIPEKISQFKRQYFWSLFAAGLKSPVSTMRKVISQLQMHHRASPQFNNPAPYLLLSIAVAEKGKGVGKVLIERVFELAWAAGYKTVGLYVNTDNISAINSYVKKGFYFRALVNNQYYMECDLTSQPTGKAA